jgi:hypothetical protein
MLIGMFAATLVWNTGHRVKDLQPAINEKGSAEVGGDNYTTFASLLRTPAPNGTQGQQGGFGTFNGDDFRGNDSYGSNPTH